MSAISALDPAISIMLSVPSSSETFLTNITAMMADAFGFGPGLPDPSGAPAAATPHSGTASISVKMITMRLIRQPGVVARI